MMSQRPLFEPGPATGNLSDRETIVLGYVRNTPFDYVTATEIGKELHRLKNCWYCYKLICQFAEGDGRQVLEQLRKRGLLRRDRHWRYTLAQPSESAQTDDVPF